MYSFKPVQYRGLDITFLIEPIHFSALHINYEILRETVPMHTHAKHCYEIHYVTEGSGSLVIDDITYKLAPGTIYVTGPSIFHEQHPHEEHPLEEICIYFQLKKTNVPPSPSRILHIFQATTTYVCQDSQDMLEPLTRLFQEMEQQKTGYRLAVKLLLQQCIIDMVRNYEGNHPEEASIKFRESQLMDQKTLMIETAFLENYDTLSLEYLSKKLALSSRQTQRLLKELYGKTFLQKRTEARMSAASVLLSAHQLSISEIADRVGYSSIEHFSAAFKNHYGVSPSNYR